MDVEEVYVGLGGNIGDSVGILQHALDKMASLPGIYDLKASSFYVTTPVSEIPQRYYVNAVCRFSTKLAAHDLLKQLQQIEIALSKTPKAKNAPRIIDLDILLFRSEIHKTPDLEIPHPRWKERLFVLKPLAELVDKLPVPNTAGICHCSIQELLKSFPNIHEETVLLLNENNLATLCKRKCS